MPAAESGATEGNLYWSMKHANMFLIMASTESGYDAASTQHQWLLKQFASINRAETPWVVVIWHRPYYSSNHAHQGEADPFKAVYEDLFFRNKVDIVFNGHVHAYERSYPVYRDAVDPKFPTTYITIGDGGNKEGLARLWLSPQPAWSAFRKSLYGPSAARARRNVCVAQRDARCGRGDTRRAAHRLRPPERHERHTRALDVARESQSAGQRGASDRCPRPAARRRDPRATDPRCAVQVLDEAWFVRPFPR